MKLEGRMYRAEAKANRLSPEIYHHFGSRYLSLGSRQHSYSRYGEDIRDQRGLRCWRDTKNGIDMNSGEPMYSHKECSIKPINGKIRQGIIHWQSD